MFIRLLVQLFSWGPFNAALAELSEADRFLDSIVILFIQVLFGFLVAPTLQMVEALVGFKVSEDLLGPKYWSRVPRISQLGFDHLGEKPGLPIARLIEASLGLEGSHPSRRGFAIPPLALSHCEMRKLRWKRMSFHHHQMMKSQWSSPDSAGLCEFY